MTKERSPAHKMIGDFAPQLADLTDRVLFGEVWERLEPVRHFSRFLRNGLPRSPLD